jgi:hypothetical protein
MGAWGHLPFENDDAHDIVSEFMDAPSFAILFACTDLVLTKEGEYIEAPDGAAVVAAAEIVAAARGKAGGGIEDKIAAAAEKLGDPPIDLVERSKRALVRVQNNSELADLWHQNKELEHDWHDSIEDLLNRLA